MARHPAPEEDTLSRYLDAIESGVSFTAFKSASVSEDESFFDQVLEGQLNVIAVANTKALSWYNNIAAIGWLFNIGEIESETACEIFGLAVECVNVKGGGEINPSVLLEMIEFMLVEIRGSDGFAIDEVMKNGLFKYIDLANERFQEMKEEGQVLCGNQRACCKVEMQLDSVGAMLV